MDKGLIKINELKKVLKELETKKIIKNKEIDNLIREYSILEENIDNLENINNNLNAEKEIIKEAPKLIKKAKIDFIKSHILANLCLAILAFLIVVGGTEGAISFSKCLKALSLGICAIYSVAVPLKFRSINKSNSIGNLEEIENSILDVNEKLELFNTKKIECNNKMVDLYTERTILKNKIIDIQKEIDFIQHVRTRVINEYCKNNPELDKKIDIAYENTKKIKEKVK